MQEPMALVATIRPAEGTADELRSALLALLPPTRAEAGCLRYELIETSAEPRRWLMVERWAGRESWQAHMASSHFRDFEQRAVALGASLEVATGTEIGC